MYDYLDFDERDELEAREAELSREFLCGLPARPGTRR